MTAPYILLTIYDYYLLMHLHTEDSIRIIDRSRPTDFLASLAHDVQQGFAGEPKELSPKYFYDENGSNLFEEITALPEYYQTRTERGILEGLAPELARNFGFSEMIEFGSGSSAKTRVLLDAFTAAGTLERYIPIDVSRDFLVSTAESLSAEYEGLRIEAVVGDFNDGLEKIERKGGGLILFLGGTIGNLYRDEAVAFLARVAAGMRPDDTLLLGVDLVKDPAVLHAAYNDSRGVTAQFNKNVLHVINSKLGGHFNPEEFWHYALYNPDDTRIEMCLVSKRDQDVHIDGLNTVVRFREGEPILTEISRKFTRSSAESLLRDAGLQLQDWHTDPQRQFGLCLAATTRTTRPISW